MNKVFLYITTESPKEAERIGRALVEARLAACANVLPRMTSIYRWQDDVRQTSEAVLILKTREDLADAAIDRVKALHSYECPCVVAIPLSGGNPEFLKWIEKETEQLID